MQTLEDLVFYANGKKELYPQIERPIQECVDVAFKGVKDGGFEDHEIELATQSIKDLIKDVHEEFEAFENT